jgi:hypothetical protein
MSRGRPPVRGSGGRPRTGPRRRARGGAAHDTGRCSGSHASSVFPRRGTGGFRPVLRTVGTRTAVTAPGSGSIATASTNCPTAMSGTAGSAARPSAVGPCPAVRASAGRVGSEAWGTTGSAEATRSGVAPARLPCPGLGGEGPASRGARFSPVPLVVPWSSPSAPHPGPERLRTRRAMPGPPASGGQTYAAHARLPPSRPAARPSYELPHSALPSRRHRAPVAPPPRSGRRVRPRRSGGEVTDRLLARPGRCRPSVAEHLVVDDST